MTKDDVIKPIDGVIYYHYDYVDFLYEQIIKLTNNWNELEEWLLNHYEVENKTQNECIDEVLNKMKEIKEGK